MKVNSTAIPLLDTIAKELALLPNHVVIEGHTDSTPAHGKTSNWELSAERANATRRELEQLGLRPEQVVEVRGYASRRPRLWHKPDDARNRRISILVLLQRRDPDRADAVPEEASPQHPLIKRLRRVDLEAQGPSDELELDPAGDRQDPL